MKRMRRRIIRDTNHIKRYEVHYNDCDLTVLSFDLDRCLKPNEIRDNEEIEPSLRQLLAEKLLRKIYGTEV